MEKALDVRPQHIQNTRNHRLGSHGRLPLQLIPPQIQLDPELLCDGPHALVELKYPQHAVPHVVLPHVSRAEHDGHVGTVELSRSGDERVYAVTVPVDLGVGEGRADGVGGVEVTGAL